MSEDAMWALGGFIFGAFLTNAIMWPLVSISRAAERAIRERRD